MGRFRGRQRFRDDVFFFSGICFVLDGGWMAVLCSLHLPAGVREAVVCFHFLWS